MASLTRIEIISIFDMLSSRFLAGRDLRKCQSFFGEITDNLQLRLKARPIMVKLH
jgi:hypothetical protein